MSARLAVGVVVGLAAAMACAREDPAAEPVATVPVAAEAPGPAVAGTETAVAEVPSAVAGEPAPASGSPSREAAPAPRAQSAADAAAPQPAEEHLPLDVLLRAPYAPGPPPEPQLDLGSLRYEPMPEKPGTPSALDQWKKRVRLQRRSDAIGPAGPRQGTVSETDAGLSVPLDDSVSVQGGIRVDQRDEPDAEEPERKSTPRVGVEVRF